MDVELEERRQQDPRRRPQPENREPRLPIPGTRPPPRPSPKPHGAGHYAQYHRNAQQERCAVVQHRVQDHRNPTRRAAEPALALIHA